MPSVNAMKLMMAAGIGAGTAGVFGFRHAQRDRTMDSEDKLGFTASSAIAGTAVGLGLGYIGPGRIMSAGMGIGKAAYGAASSIPSKAAMKVMGARIGFKAGPKELQSTLKAARGTLTGLAMAAAAVGVAALTRRHDHEREDIAESDIPRNSVRERLDMMNSAGDVVFGLNNARHG